MIRRDAWREYSRGSLWLLPVVAVVVSVGLGAVLSRINVSAGLVAGLPGDRGRCAQPVDRHLQHDGHRHRAPAGPGGGGAAAVIDPVLPPVAAQLPARPAEPGRAQRLRRHLRLQRGRAVRGRGVRRGAGDRVPTVRRHRRGRAVVPQPRAAGVLRRSPGPLDPGRPGHAGGRERHAGRHQEAADGRRANGDAATRRTRRGGAIVRIRAGHLRRCAAEDGCGAPRPHPAATQGRRARRGGHRAGLGVAYRRADRPCRRASTPP